MFAVFAFLVLCVAVVLLAGTTSLADVVSFTTSASAAVNGASRVQLEAFGLPAIARDCLVTSRYVALKVKYRPQKGGDILDGSWSSPRETASAGLIRARPTPTGGSGPTQLPTTTTTNRRR